MIHEVDEQSIQRMLGISELPSELVRECELRTRMYHCDGNSGPMGALSLIAMLRWLGYVPPSTPEPTGKTDWRPFKQDGSVRVEARFFGEWMPGVFRGFVESGTLAVLLDHEDFMKECRPDMVRLALSQEPFKRETSTDTVSAATRTATDDETPFDVGTEEVLEDDSPDIPTFDWTKIDANEAVWVEDDGDIRDAKFIRLGADSPSGQQLVVHFDGEDEPREVMASVVEYAGEPKPLAGVA